MFWQKLQRENKRLNDYIVMNGLINCDTYDINQILLLQTFKSILQIS